MNNKEKIENAKFEIEAFEEEIEGLKALLRIKFFLKASNNIKKRIQYYKDLIEKRKKLIKKLG